MSSGPPGVTDSDVQLITDEIKRTRVIYNHILVVKVLFDIYFVFIRVLGVVN